MRVLIADDEYSVRGVLGEMALSLGYDKIDTVCDGQAAHNLSGIQYDLVLLDLHMGKTDGVEAAHLMKAFGNQGNIIIITGDDDEVDADGFPVLRKPFSFDELSDAIKNLCQERL